MLCFLPPYPSPTQVVTAKIPKQVCGHSARLSPRGSPAAPTRSPLAPGAPRGTGAPSLSLPRNKGKAGEANMKGNEARHIARHY